MICVICARELCSLECPNFVFCKSTKLENLIAPKYESLSFSKPPSLKEETKNDKRLPASSMMIIYG